MKTDDDTYVVVDNLRYVQYGSEMENALLLDFVNSFS